MTGTEGDRAGPGPAATAADRTPEPDGRDCARKPPAPAPAGPDRVAALLEDVAALAVRHLVTREISFTAAATLGRLARGGPQRLTRLAADEGVGQPSMSQLVGRLTGHGLVERVRDPQDGRVVLVGITDAGRRLVERRRTARLTRLRELVAGLPDEDRHALTEAARIAAPAVRHLTEAALGAPARTPPDGPQ